MFRRSVENVLVSCLEFMEPGDTLVGPAPDRLSRSLQDLITVVPDLRRRGVGFTSLHESLDTTNPGGRLVFHVFAALAECASADNAETQPWSTSGPQGTGRDPQVTVAEGLVRRISRMKDLWPNPHHQAKRLLIGNRDEPVVLVELGSMHVEGVHDEVPGAQLGRDLHHPADCLGEHRTSQPLSVQGSVQR
jgi:hypothetical protein